MRLPRLICLGLVTATAALAIAAGGASSGAAASPQGGASSTAVAKVHVKYTIKRFVRKNHRLVAYGRVNARYSPLTEGTPATSSKPFKARVLLDRRRLSSVQTICPVLDLVLGPVDLNLLGALVHLDQLHVTITGDTSGGVLGKLLCSLSSKGKLTSQTKKLNVAVKKSGLTTSGTGFTVTVQSPSSTGTSGAAPDAVSTICPVLDLTIGPIHLDLLGLVVDTNTIHLTIEGDSTGGVLGSLLCSLSGTTG